MHLGRGVCTPDIESEGPLGTLVRYVVVVLKSCSILDSHISTQINGAVMWNGKAFDFAACALALYIS